MLIHNIVSDASKILKKNKIKSHLLDAEIILADLMNISREHLITSNYLPVSNKIKKKFNYAIKRRYRREPVAYITKKKEFWSLDFIINKFTLVPRPETELLVNEIIKLLKNKRIYILDIGTGSGCILLSLLKELQFAKGAGLDVSAKAINVAKKNAKKFRLSNRTRFIVDSIDNFKLGKYDLIVSNPPYIPFNEISKLDEEITNFEPLCALNGGIDGLDLIRKVIYKSNILLKTNGHLAIEIGNSQYTEVAKILRDSCYREISKVCDFERNVRCIISTKI